MLNLIDTMSDAETGVDAAAVSGMIAGPLGGAGPAGGAWVGTPDKENPWDYKEPGDSWLKNPGWFEGSGITIGDVKYTRRAWPDGLSEDEARRHILRKLDEGFKWENTSETWKR